MAEVRVLIVDDQEAYLAAMTRVVQEADGFVVVGSARSGEESLTAVDDLRPHLVLMDVHLPGIDGVEAARRITRRPGSPVVVLLSTYDEDQLDLAGSGVSGYLSKAVFAPDRLAELWAGLVS